MRETPSSQHLIEQLRDAHTRTLELVRGLSSEQLMGPKLRIVNPLRWEIGHVAYFHEYWLLRYLDGRPPIIANADALYDSITIDHEERWDLPLPSMEDTLDYVRTVLDAEVERLDTRTPSSEDLYLTQYAVFHQDMHNEAFTYTRQTLAYPEPSFELAVVPQEAWEAGPLPGDVAIPGGTYMLGSQAEDDFVFDNEKWAHPVEVAPFSIARAPVTNNDYLAFVTDGGYRRKELWDDAGWRWRETRDLQHPVYWRERDAGRWEIREFDHFAPLRPHRPVSHISWYEAQAWCRWADRRLPTEAEWEFAAAAEPLADGEGVRSGKRRFPWGEQAPAPHRANLDGRALGCIDVGACPAGDSAFGCRQMIGNVWEWTDTTFAPYPGFTPDMYQDYSQPLFGSTKVLRGGCWATRGRMLRNTWRNYYGPDRNDVFSGFRTCALA